MFYNLLFYPHYVRIPSYVSPPFVRPTALSSSPRLSVGNLSWVSTPFIHQSTFWLPFPKPLTRRARDVYWVLLCSVIICISTGGLSPWVVHDDGIYCGRSVWHVSVWHCKWSDKSVTNFYIIYWPENFYFTLKIGDYIALRVYNTISYEWH